MLLLLQWATTRFTSADRESGASAIEVAVITAFFATLAIAVCAASGVGVWALFEPMFSAKTPRP
jgi:Flp pilus assembly pilin Flp